MKITPDPRVIKLLSNIVKHDTTDRVNTNRITKDEFFKSQPPKEDFPSLHYDSDTSAFAVVANALTDIRLRACAKLLGSPRCSNALLYPEHSVMDWHTNSDAVGKRIYYTYTLGEALFRYIDHDGVEKVDVDNVGWTARQFYISDKNLLWHTIWTEQKRYAFGFIFPDAKPF